MRVLSIMLLVFLSPVFCSAQTIVKVDLAQLWGISYANFVPISLAVEQKILPRNSVHISLTYTSIEGGGSRVIGNILAERTTAHRLTALLELRQYFAPIKHRKIGSFFVGSYAHYSSVDLIRSGITSLEDEFNAPLYGVGLNLGFQFNYKFAVIELLLGSGRYRHNIQSLGSFPNISEIDLELFARYRIEVSLGYKF